MTYFFTAMFWIMFIGYTTIVLMGGFEQARGLEFLLGITLFGMLNEMTPRRRCKCQKSAT